MATTFRTESIVLKKEPWREYDRLYTLYTREAGKLQAIAKGSRRSLSRMAAHLEPFLITDVMIARGRQIDKLAGSEQVKNYKNLDQSVEKVALLSYCFELLDELTSYAQPDRRIFELACELLEISEANHLFRERSFLLARIFSLKLLSLLGYEPELKTCLECKRVIGEEGVYFNSTRGGIVCPSCAERLGNQLLGQVTLSEPVLKVLRNIQEQNFSGFLELYIMPEVIKSLDIIIDEFLKYHLDGELRSEAYFYQVFKD
ncbi:DNA repair protein RecO [Candidatus Saccharibacteria bacterium]|nr:DNA repair protein RecO [Candidatus Saccharibacteria bacterium]NIV03746.1 DNA repair protein RecO [Calditrichia bacterium]NIS38263.1 DNA repair protein RecO [Candidatus Saccharibacteria bacterium]NIV72043.1 DNA repair protein RecO [Calditrichia bacterium]NIV98891.1 DNA repair protein RecO [Candidatus Saccharibacteria bacterium]